MRLRDIAPHASAIAGIAAAIIQTSVVQPTIANWWMFSATRRTLAADMITQNPQLQLGRIGSAAALNSRFSSTVIIAGNTSSVTAPDKPIIAHKNIPTVLYGTSGAASSGRKPIAITNTFLLIARAGSPNIS